MSGCAPASRTVAPGRSWFGLAALLGALSSFAPLAIDMYLPAFPDVARDLDASIGAVQLSLSTGLAGLAIGQALYGPLSDAYGRRWPAAAGTVLFVGASIGCALAPSVGVLIALRFVQTFGGCAGLVIARAIVRDLFSGTAAARFFSLLFGITMLAPILAPLLGAQLLRVGSWRWIFVVLAGFGLVCLVGITRLPETLAPENRRRAGPRAVFGAYRSLARNRSFLVISTVSGLVFAAMFAYIAAIPGVLIDGEGLSPQLFSLVFGANAAGIAVMSLAGARALRRHRPAVILRTAVTVQACAALCLLVTAGADLGGLAGLLVPLFVIVSAVGAAFPSALALALEPFPHMAGAASGGLGVLQQLLGAGAAAAVAALAADSAAAMAMVIGVICALAAVLVWAPQGAEKRD